ncbi:MAG: hypothetical protein ACRELC_06115 [Gemmatimonadota bacterium]
MWSQRKSRDPRAVLAIGGLFLVLVAARAQQEAKPPAEAAETLGQQLVEGFSVASPFDPDAPDHLWLDNGDGTFMFLHFDKPIEQATKVIYVGWAVPGRWCAEDQPEAFTHFHRTAKVADWNAGHGGAEPGDPGFWLKHVAVEEFDLDMMGMSYHVTPGTDMKFMPTNPPRCS